MEGVELPKRDEAPAEVIGATTAPRVATLTP